MRSPELPHERVLTRLGLSTIDGVGVFAIVAIAAGTELFPHDDAKICWIDADRVDEAEPGEEHRALYRDFAIRRDGQLGCPASFDMLTPGWYVNQPVNGDPPNIRASDNYCLFAVRDIEVGEELTVDYEAFNTGSPWA